MVFFAIGPMGRQGDDRIVHAEARWDWLNSGPINVYRLSISGQKATVIGTTRLDAPQERHRGQSWIQGKTIIGINYYHGRPQITFWPYPRGGNPSREITHSQNPAASIFVGVTVSAAPSGARIHK